MNVHEYQAKGFLKSFHIPVPFGVCIEENASSAIATALRAFENHSKVVVKAQIHAGGRGKGHFKENGTSGVRLVETECAAEAVADMFGKTLKELCDDGFAEKNAHMPEDTRKKFAETIERVINEGAGGMICILL